MAANPDPLRAALTATGLSQLALAEALGVDGRTVRRWLAGDSAVPGPVDRLCRLLAAEPSLVLQLTPRP